MTEQIPGIPQELELTIPIQPNRPQQEIIPVEPFDLVKDAITAECQVAQIDPQKLPIAVKRTLSRIIGQTLSDHTSDLIEDYKLTHPGQKPPIGKVPGALIPALRTVYDKTRADQPQYDHSRMIYQRADDYRQPLINTANIHRDKYPEIGMAYRLAGTWHDEGLMHASDGAINLVVSYGHRIKTLLNARQQRRAEEYGAQTRRFENERLQRIMRES